MSLRDKIKFVSFSFLDNLLNCKDFLNFFQFERRRLFRSIQLLNDLHHSSRVSFDIYKLLDVQHYRV